MKVDRQSFLLAAAAIAAACGPTSPQGSSGATAVTIPPQPPPPEPSEWNQPPPAKPPAPVAEAEPRPPARPRVAPTEEGWLTSPMDEGLSTGPKNVGAMCRSKAPPPGPSAAACADDQGAPGDCKKANCKSLPFICDQCEAYKKYFKARIAQRAVACVVGQTKAESRDGCKTYECGDAALKTACPDAAADAACRTIAPRCRATIDECRSLLAGMNAQGRAKIQTCAQSGCSYGLWSCVEGL